MEKVFTDGLMERNMMENGIRESNYEKKKKNIFIIKIYIIKNLYFYFYLIFDFFSR
jgi:hypothetical protein